MMYRVLKRSLSVALACALCFSLVSMAQSVFAAPNETNMISQQNAETSQLPLQDKPEVISDAQILEKGHVARLYQDEPDLSTICFKNQDGTTSVYFFPDPVKYVDSSGDIKDKSNILYRSTYIETLKTYAFVNKDNDIQTHFPKHLSEDTCIIVDDGTTQIKMWPSSNVETTAQLSTSNKEQASSNCVYYNKAFGDDTALIYYPTFDGVKEDIVLYRDVGNYKFNFYLKVDGLTACIDNGKVLLNNLRGNAVGFLDEIIVYDSATSPNITYSNTYQIESVDSNGLYLLSVIVDSSFIKNSQTVFPVYIDPTVNIYSTSSVGGTIQSAPIYSGSPTTAYPSTTTYNIGYSGSLGIGRALYRFPAFYNSSTYSSLKAGQITEFKFCICETSKGATVGTVCACIYNGPAWTETSATYSNTSGGAYSTVISSIPMGNTVDQFYAFDLIPAMNLWKSGQAVPSKGIVLINANQTSNSYMKAFYSNRSSSNKPYLRLTYYTYYATVNSRHDNGYPVRYGETAAQSRTAINGYVDACAARYFDLLDLKITRNSCSYFSSAIDTCKGTVTSSNINTLCSSHNPIHTELDSVISNFNTAVTGSNTTTNVYWSGHRITDPDLGENRCVSSGTNVIMIELSTGSNRYRDMTGVLFHEINHQYGAPDHYHEILPSGACRGGALCSQCGSSPRPATCSMNNARQNISLSTILCNGCKSNMLSHLNGHHNP